jgi:hypothetical protein
MKNNKNTEKVITAALEDQIFNARSEISKEALYRKILKSPSQHHWLGSLHRRDCREFLAYNEQFQLGTNYNSMLECYKSANWPLLWKEAGLSYAMFSEILDSNSVYCPSLGKFM